MRKLTTLFIVAILCGAASLICSCASARTINGESLSRRASLKKEAAAAISKIVEERLGRDTFWDGPYQVGEAARHTRIGIGESGPLAFTKFAARHHNERFYVCFDYLVLYGFTDHGAERAEGYSPMSILALSDNGVADWFDIDRPNKSTETTRGK